MTWAFPILVATAASQSQNRGLGNNGTKTTHKNGLQLPLNGNRIVEQAPFNGSNRLSLSSLTVPLRPRPQCLPVEACKVEMAVAARCAYIVTYNLLHFWGSEKFGVQAVTPYQMLELLHEASTESTLVPRKPIQPTRKFEEK